MATQDIHENSLLLILTDQNLRPYSHCIRTLLIRCKGFANKSKNKKEKETYLAQEIYDVTRFLKIDRSHMNASFPHWHRVEIWWLDTWSFRVCPQQLLPWDVEQIYGTKTSNEHNHNEILALCSLHLGWLSFGRAGEHMMTCIMRKNMCCVQRSARFNEWVHTFMLIKILRIVWKYML